MLLAHLTQQPVGMPTFPAKALGFSCDINFDSLYNQIVGQSRRYRLNTAIAAISLVLAKSVEELLTCGLP